MRVLFKGFCILYHAAARTVKIHGAVVVGSGFDVDSPCAFIMTELFNRSAVLCFAAACASENLFTVKLTSRLYGCCPYALIVAECIGCFGIGYFTAAGAKRSDFAVCGTSRLNSGIPDVVIGMTESGKRLGVKDFTAGRAKNDCFSVFGAGCGNVCYFNCFIAVTCRNGFCVIHRTAS